MKGVYSNNKKLLMCSHLKSRIIIFNYLIFNYYIRKVIIATFLILNKTRLPRIEERLGTLINWSTSFHTCIFLICQKIIPSHIFKLHNISSKADYYYDIGHLPSNHMVTYEIMCSFQCQPLLSFVLQHKLRSMSQ